MTQNNEDTIKALMSLGLSEQKAKETLKNTTVTSTLLKILHEVRGVNISDGVGTLLYQLGTKIKPQISHHLPILVKYIASNKLDTTLRVDKAIEFALSHIKELNTNELETFCGVGVVITPEQIEKVVEKYIKDNKKDLLEKRYRFNTGPLMQKVRADLVWADGKAVKSEVDLQVIF
uniref:Probable glutamine--tRNA ligase n=1 Tax=Diabrotica virgifera virgifera TaxID=50390 RepID=A0A6P7H6X2_DIAVI